MPPKPNPPRLRPTHFLALTATPHLSKTPFPTSYTDFRTTATQPTHSLPPLAIRPIGTLHLTLCVLHLPTQSHVDGVKLELGKWMRARHTSHASPQPSPPHVESSSGTEPQPPSPPPPSETITPNINANTTTTAPLNPTPPQGIKTALKGLHTFPGGSLQKCRVLYISPTSHVPGEIQRVAESVREWMFRCEGHAGMVLSREEEEFVAKQQGVGGGEVGEGGSGSSSAGDSAGGGVQIKNEGGNKVAVAVEPPTSISTSTATSASEPALPPATLHMTVMNTVYAKPKGGHGHGHGRGHGRGRGGGGGRVGSSSSRGGSGSVEYSRDGYDVRQLVEEFKDFVWAEEVIFDKVELLKMGEVKVKRMNGDGEEVEDARYEVCGHVDL
ncbi:hypothetical protein DFH27DRAFT_199121 [Peziza echinospora]|nr:hypothetical protein DFH27DRAFT_199121 [Peziza echinospora]